MKTSSTTNPSANSTLSHQNILPNTVLPQVLVEYVWNLMAYAQKPDFVYRRSGRVHLHRRGSQFSRLLVAEVCASQVVVLDTPCSEVVCRVMATHTIRQFALHFPIPCVAVCHQVSTGLYHFLFMGSNIMSPSRKTSLLQSY